jgi:Terpene cyclase DEP1
MTSKDKLLCGTYALIALVALPATWINNLAFMTQANNASFTDFFRAAYANAAAASLSNDLFLLAFAASIFMVIEGRRVGIRYVGFYIALSAILAISVTFPLFLLARQIKMSNEPSALNTLNTRKKGTDIGGSNIEEIQA